MSLCKAERWKFMTGFSDSWGGTPLLPCCIRGMAKATREDARALPAKAPSSCALG